MLHDLGTSLGVRMCKVSDLSFSHAKQYCEYPNGYCTVFAVGPVRSYTSVFSGTDSDLSL